MHEAPLFRRRRRRDVCEVSDHNALLARPEEEEEEEGEGQTSGSATGEREGGTGAIARYGIRPVFINGRMIPNLEAGGGISSFLCQRARRDY